MLNKTLLIFLSFTTLLFACEQKKRLPILGPSSYEVKVVDGKEVTDTIYATIPEFQFTDQDGNLFSEDNLEGKFYVADFFFTTCPSICPIMKTQMLRIHDQYKDLEDFKIVSHSIDPSHDTVEVLREYADRLGVDTKQWSFLTGEMDNIFRIAQEGYMVSAKTDSLAPGGLLHSGAFILIDKRKRIRGYYDGTVESDVDQLISDILVLKSEYGEE